MDIEIVIYSCYTDCGDNMVCRNCGKALSNEQATCPFCGVFISSDQISEYVEMKKEKSKDLRPKLLSEQYGMKPIKYEKIEQTNQRLFVILGICGVLVILFLITLFILF